jgi:signal transduction histidine kinase
MTRRFAFFRFMQLFLILIMPFIVQTALGGFVAGSGVVIWSILSPLGALMFSGPNRARPWLLAFLGVLAAAVLLEAPASGWSAPIPNEWRVFSFPINFFGLSYVVYFLERYFVVQKEKLQREIGANAVKLIRMEELDQENERLIKLDQMKDNFISAVSHELRTPLTSIQGYSKLLASGKSGNLDEMQKDFIDTILRNSQRLYILVSDLLDVSRLDSRNFPLDLAETKPEEIVAGAVSSLKILSGTVRPSCWPTPPAWNRCSST